ncbi:MAG: helix-turn-helix domain-containing protein [Candidatus Aenigmarchaeota archaeon]|nr:helix-turn-helix domain-containing protein [Candidatus Aenigmarchaeota archaeon]
MEKNEENIIEPLLISEEKVRENLKMLVSKATSFISIEDKTGRIIFNKNNLANWEKVGLLLVGKYFAEIGKLVKTSTLTMREIASELELPITTIPAPLKKLIRLGYVEKTGKSYRIRFSQIEKFLNELIKKHGEKT